MKTFSFFDYGMTPPYQCTVDAEDLEQAQHLVAEAGRPVHRLTAVLGLRLAGYVGGKDLEHTQFQIQKCISRAAALERVKEFIPDKRNVECCEFFCWLVVGNPEGTQILPVRLEIDDLKAEFAKYNVPYYP